MRSAASPGYRNPDDGGRAGGILGASTGWVDGNLPVFGGFRLVMEVQTMTWYWKSGLFLKWGLYQKPGKQQSSILSPKIDDVGKVEAPDLDFRKFAEERGCNGVYGVWTHPFLTHTQVIYSHIMLHGIFSYIYIMLIDFGKHWICLGDFWGPTK